MSRAALKGGPAPILALYDLGTNSLRLDVVAFKGRQARLLCRERRMTRLGDGLYRDGKADPHAVRRVDEALAELTALHRSLGATRVAAVATAAMRAASDRRALADRWRARFGVDFRVISGEEEAALIARGVLAAEKPPAGAFGLMDLGGGSTEFILCRGRRALNAVSLPLGANRAQQEFLGGIPPREGGVEALRREVGRAFRGLLPAKTSVAEIIGSGGTVRAIRRLAKAAGVRDRPFSLAFLSGLTRRLAGLDRTALVRVPGMAENRMDLILGGAVLLEEAALAVGAVRIRTTEAGLRDGLLAFERETLGL